jgi:hypothetical protein
MSEREEVSYREGRGEMKYDVFKEIEILKQEFLLHPEMEEEDKNARINMLEILEKRLHKL